MIMSNRHQPYDLKQMQSLPLEAKIIMTQQRIRQWYDYWEGDVYVSFSGGKDSTVLKHIVDNTPGVWDVPAVFVNTGLEYPEIQKFVKDVKPTPGNMNIASTVVKWLTANGNPTKKGWVLVKSLTTLALNMTEYSERRNKNVPENTVEEDRF